jgi:hypothetical protein
VKPNLSSEEERRLRAAFQAVRSHDVGLSITSIRIDEGRARVRVSRRDTLDGKAMTPIEQTFVLARGPGGWTIREITQ